MTFLAHVSSVSVQNLPKIKEHISFSAQLSTPIEYSLKPEPISVSVAIKMDTSALIFMNMHQQQAYITI